MIMEVANTILKQLGGNRFVAMTGAKHLGGTADSLSFKVPHAAKKITHVRIVLSPLDTYTVTFHNCRTTPKQIKNEIVATHENVYAEDLQSIFTSETGLYTKF